MLFLFLIQCRRDLTEYIYIFCDPPLNEEKFYIYGSYDSLSIIEGKQPQTSIGGISSFNDDCPFVSILMCGRGGFGNMEIGITNVAIDEEGTFEIILIYNSILFAPYDSNTKEFYLKGIWDFYQHYDYAKVDHITHFEFQQYISGIIQFEIDEPSTKSTNIVGAHGIFMISCSGEGLLTIEIPDQSLYHEIYISFLN